MCEIIFIVEKAIEGGFFAHALNHSIITEGEDLAELNLNVKDAIQCHFDSEEEAHIPQYIYPSPTGQKI
ncbi:MAG: 2-oxoisovalerate dehydrogenase [Nitrospirae bacterium]|nr:2-oxoisovalerate dehydrogenase [Nitrospirota bacterium]